MLAGLCLESRFLASDSSPTLLLFFGLLSHYLNVEYTRNQGGKEIETKNHMYRIK